MNINELFWNASLQELKNGYIYSKQDEKYICLMCGESFNEGEIYKKEDKFYNAEKMMKYHVEEVHNGVFDYLINLNKKYTGLSENQKEVLMCFQKGMTDSDVSAKLKLSRSTIRNYRFKFREKEKQAKIYTAIMELLDGNTNEEYKFVDPHNTAAMIDERYSITKEESEKIIGRYFDGTGKLIDFPAKEKRKIIILTKLSTNFRRDVNYTEKEVNRILKRIYEDYVLLRRYLIEYGYMDRSKDGSKYWLR